METLNKTEEEKYVDEIVERKATNLFCEKGYPNPLHVFDISPSGICYLNQEPMSKEKAKELKSEATLLKGTTLYQVIQESLRQEAIKRGIIYSKNWEEVLAGKMMLHNLGIIKKIIDTIASIDTEKLADSSTKMDNLL